LIDVSKIDNFQGQTNKPTKSNQIQPIQPNPTKSIMVFNFDEMKETMKKRGYTMIDYTKKIKTLQDFAEIENKMKTKRDGVFVYSKTIIVIRMQVVAKKIPIIGVLFVMKHEPIGIRLLNRDNYLSFEDRDETPNAIVIERFTTQGEEVMCEVCCENIKPADMCYCNNCAYNCCNECFDKKFIMSFKSGKPDPRCFGCRMPLTLDIRKKSKYFS
jgi:hypothetical protein